MEDAQSALCTVNDDNTIQDMKEQTMDNDEDMDCDSGAENLDLMVGLMDEHSELQSEIVKLCNSFVEDVGERMKTCDIPYLTGLKKFFSVYLETINSTEPTIIMQAPCARVQWTGRPASACIMRTLL